MGLELIYKEVFYSPRLRVPLNEVVRNATGGLCTDDLAPSVELDIPEPKPRDLLGDDLLESIRSYSEASTTEQGIDFPIPESGRIVQLMNPAVSERTDPTQPSFDVVDKHTGTRVGKIAVTDAWTTKEWREAFRDETSKLDIPLNPDEIQDITKIALRIRWIKYFLRYLGYSEKQIKSSSFGRVLGSLTLDALSKMKKAQLRRLINLLTTNFSLKKISEEIGKRSFYDVSGDLLRYAFEYLYTYMPVFRLAIDTGKRTGKFYQYGDWVQIGDVRKGWLDPKGNAVTPQALITHLKKGGIDFEVDFGKTWAPQDEETETKRYPSLENREKGWVGSFQDALSEIGESMAHECIETYVYDRLRQMLTETKSTEEILIEALAGKIEGELILWEDKDERKYCDENRTKRIVAIVKKLTPTEKEDLFALSFRHITNPTGPAHQITDAYCWEWGRKGFFWTLAKMEPWTGGVVVTLDSIIEKYCNTPWTIVELLDENEENYIDFRYDEEEEGKKIAHRPYNTL